MHGLSGSAQPPLWQGPCNAAVDTSTTNRFGVSFDLHDLGVHLLGDSFRYRNIPAFSDGRNSFSDCRRGALRWDAFERRTSSNTGQLEAATIVGGLLLLGGNGGVTKAELVIPSSLAAVLITTVPIWMALLELLRKDRIVPTLHVIIGLVLGFGGVILLVGPGDLGGSGGLNSLWAGVLIFAALSWAIGSVYSRNAPLPKTPLLGSGMEMLAGGALLLVASLISQEWAGFQPGNVSFLSLVSFIYLIVFGSLIGFSSYVWLLTKTTTARVSTYAYVNPAAAVFLGYFLVGEQLTLRTLLASSVIVIAVVVITTFKSRQTVPDNNGSTS